MAGEEEAGRRTRGRPSKGARKIMKAVLPDALAAAVKAEADRRGMTIIDFFGHLASEATGVPYEFEEPLSLSA